MQITEDRKKMVIDLYFNQHKSYTEIAEIEKISPRDIHAIIMEEKAKQQKHKYQELSARTYELFNQKKTTVQVAIALSLTEPRVSKMYREYWRLKRLHILILIYKVTNGKLWPFLKLYRQLIKEKHMSVDQVVNAVEIDIHRLPYMENLYQQARDEAEKMQHTIQRSANHITVLEHKISLLDKIAFASEQECKRTEQQVQELRDKKDRIERLIANIVNGKEYSKLKHIVKENVKVVLSDNKMFLSAAFAALLQTLKDDPESVNLIYSTSTANSNEQHKDDNKNNTTKYFESNKDGMLYLTEKHYQKLVEALTINAINAVDASSSHNPTLSLPQSSSQTFSAPSDQSDIYGIEDPESFRNCKDDITD